jgi:hypothetical protein
MAKKTKRKPKWTLLFQFEDGNQVFLYEPLKKYEINSRMRAGWKVID